MLLACAIHDMRITTLPRVATNKELRAGRTVIDSIVWAPYGDQVVEDAERQRYLDHILGIAKVVLPDAIDHFHQDKNGSFPVHLEHVRPCRQALLLTFPLRGKARPELHSLMLAMG